MSATPATNTTLEGLAQALKSCEHITICGHTSPDGDCIGSQLAMKCALEQLGKKVDVLLAQNEPAPYHFDFLPGFKDLIYAGRKKGTIEAFLMIDAPNDSRIGYPAADLRKKAKHAFTLDHHFEEEQHSELGYTDPDAASTTILVWEMLPYLGVEKTKDVATCCLTGLMTDTGNFQYQNADIRAFKAATEMLEAGASTSEISANVFMRNSLAMYKLQSIVFDHMEIFCDGACAVSYVSQKDFEESGASKADYDSQINLLRALDGTQVVAMLRESTNFVKVSFRSLGSIDCRELTAVFGGGGHQGAAGATIKEPLDKAVAMVKELLEKTMKEAK